MASSQSSSVHELPATPPKVLQEAVQPGKVNPLTPALKTPRASEIAAAVIDRAPMVPRERIAESLDAVAPHLAAKIRECGEVDPDGDPHIEFINSLVALAAMNYARRIYEATDPVLVKGEGQESANFVHQSARAGVEVSP